MTDYPAATQQRCRAIVYYDGSLVFEENHPTRRERFDAVLEHLKSNHGEVSDEEIEDVMANVLYRPSLTGGHSDDELYDDALAEIISELYAVYAGDITVHLDEPEMPVPAPATLYSVVTDYGKPVVDALDGSEHSMIVEHFPTEAALLASLRERANTFAELYSRSVDYTHAGQAHCLEMINRALEATGGRITVLSSNHIGAGSYAPDY